MRFHYSFAVSKFLRELKEAGAPIRRIIESLQHNPLPDDVIKIDGYESRYEVFVAGYWVVYEVDQTNPSETIIRVIMVEAN